MIKINFMIIEIWLGCALDGSGVLSQHKLVRSMGWCSNKPFLEPKVMPYKTEPQSVNKQEIGHAVSYQCGFLLMKTMATNLQIKFLWFHSWITRHFLLNCQNLARAHLIISWYLRSLSWYLHAGEKWWEIERAVMKFHHEIFDHG